MLVTALSPLAQSVGANRIVQGRAVDHPFGEPDMAPDDEQELRRRIVESSLAALGTEVGEPTIFLVDR